MRIVILLLLAFVFDAPAEETREQIIQRMRRDRFAREPERSEPKKIAALPFRIDSRWGNWETNKTRLLEKAQLAVERGDYLAGVAIRFKMDYAAYFKKYFETGLTSGQDYLGPKPAERKAEFLRKREEAIKKRSVQEKFGNSEAVARIDQEISSIDASVREITARDVPEQHHAFWIANVSNVGFLLRVAHSEYVVGNRLESDGNWIREIREFRERLAVETGKEKVVPRRFQWMEGNGDFNLVWLDDGRRDVS